MRHTLGKMAALAGVCSLAFLAAGCCTCPQNTAEVAEIGLLTDFSGMTLNKNAALQVYRQGQTVRTIGFGKDEAAWDQTKINNYSKLLDIQFGKEVKGIPSLYVGGGKPRKTTDTAWQIETKKMPFDAAGNMFSVKLEAFADFTIAGISSGTSVEGQGYDSRINWFDENGQALSSMQLSVFAGQTSFSQTQTLGYIPAGAKQYSFRLGFDAPNVNVGNFCAFSKLELATLSEDSPFVEQSWFEVAPMLLDEPAISWKADCPKGTSVSLQVAYAKDNDGVPGAWSDFQGPDGTANSYFTSPFKAAEKWVKIRVFYQAKGQACPAITALDVNGRSLNKWSMYREQIEPLIENISVSPTLNRREDIVLRISGMTPIAWPTFKATIDGEDATAQFSRLGNVMIGKAAKDYTDGLHKIEASVKDINGKEAKGVKYLFIGESPANVPHVTLRDDGMTLVNGKPIFPIGPYAVWKREFNNNDFDKAFKDLSEAGFNFAHSYNGGPEYKDFLDTAHKYGMYVWSGAYDINSKDFNTIRKNHPAVIAWYIGDDTSMNTTINQLQDRHDALKAIDDHRITTQADPLGSQKTISNYHDYVRGSDNILPEIYPVHVDTLEDRANCVPEVIRDMKTAALDHDTCGIRHPRSIWPIIQYFQGWSGWKRFPEEHEIRAMSFASIIHGATGITWYTYGGYHDPKNNRTNYGITSTPERWRIITTITRQLRELEPVLVERTPKNQPEANVLEGPKVDVLGYPAVTCLLKKHNGETYILAVNSTLDTVKAEIPVCGIDGGSVMFEDRTAPCKDGKLTDTFKPYDVHIYRLK